MHENLRILNDMRKASGGQYMMEGRLTFADMVSMNALSCVTLPRGFSRRGPNMSKDWEEPTIVGDFGDMIDWRNKLYLEHRGDSPAQDGKHAKL